MKKLLLVSLISVLAVVFILPAFAGQEESLQVQVSTPSISISLSESSINFGTLNLGEEKISSIVPVVTNVGSVNVDLDIKGTDATYEGNTWWLDGVSNGPDQYMLMIAKGGNWATDVLNLTTGYQEFYANPPLDVNAGQNFHVKILMPTTTSAYGDYTANIYVRATQSGT